MTLALVLIAAVMVLALSQRLRLRLTWGPAGRSVSLRYLMIRLRSDSGRLREPAEAMAPKVAKARKRKPRRADGRRRWRWSWRRLIGLLPEAAGAVWKGGGFLVRRCRIEYLRIEGPIGTPDPALTGMLWGAVSALQDTIVTQSVAQVRLWPEFVEDRTQVTFDATLSVRAGALLAAPLLLVWHLPKRSLWQAFRSARSSEKGKGSRSTMIEEGDGKP